MAYKGNGSVTRKQSRFYAIAFAAAIFLSLLAVVSYLSGVSSILANAVSFVTAPLDAASSAVAAKASRVADYFGNTARLKEENRRLQAENDELQRLYAQSEAVREENEKLYAFLDLKREFTDLELVNASVISGGSGSFLTTFTIDKGTLHGVHKDMPILCADGVLGIVTQEGLTTSRGITLIHYKASAGVYILRTGMPALLEGDFESAANGCCRISGLAPDTDAEVGDLIYTSGLGEIFPKDLYVGKVIEVKRDDTTYTLTLIVQPPGNLSDLDTVMVITGYTQRYEQPQKGGGKTENA